MKHLFVFTTLALGAIASAQSSGNFHVIAPKQPTGLSHGSSNLLQPIANQIGGVPVASGGGYNPNILTNVKGPKSITITSSNSASANGGVHFQAVPEPSSLAFLAAAPLTLLFKKRKK